MFMGINFVHDKNYSKQKGFVMKNLKPKWVTIRFQGHMFDVQLLDQKISEIRTIDSEINILNIMDKQTLHTIQNLAKENHHAV